MLVFLQIRLKNSLMLPLIHNIGCLHKDGLVQNITHLQDILNELIITFSRKLVETSLIYTTLKNNVKIIRCLVYRMKTKHSSSSYIYIEIEGFRVYVVCQ